MNCADSIRVVHPLFQVEGSGANPTSALQLHVGEIHVSKAIALNWIWHSRLPNVIRGNIDRNRRSVCYAAEFGGLFFASAIWTDPVAANRLTGGDAFLELRRLAISDDAPKNTASRMIAVMIRLLRRKFPELRKLISYQDTEAHSGTIYLASGWTAAARTELTEWKTARRMRVASQASSHKIRWEYDLCRT